ncbi:MAG: V-type ATP synthase subunit A [Nitrospinota bacterium]|nr:V-type ATP synthase subunit A [Nitrospinota bacterium]
MREGEQAAGVIVRVNGPVVTAEGLPNAHMYDVVRVGEGRLVGEVIGLERGRVVIQVYEETGGVSPGEPVVTTGLPLSVELGPGLMGAIYDGIQRPLNLIREQVGDFIVRGVEEPALDREKAWEFIPRTEAGARVGPGDVLGVIQETEAIEHRVLVPPDISGRVGEIRSGALRIEETAAVIEGEGGDRREIGMVQRWPVRTGRPYARKLPPAAPLISGQRVIDTFFPVAKGGAACIPGPFGSGKTVVQHQLSKWSNAEIIVFVGCGERGNEMTDVLKEFPHLTDPHTGLPLMQRTVLIANTSNMPVAAREASVYTGITIAEYFRDMGYDVALMADSTSRWAEAMREISGRLEEMPGEEGYPAYLGTRVASFYERAGRVQCLGSEAREGTITVIGAVSPPGGDLSEPVVQSTLRTVSVFWSLEADLAYQRHFPAISWLRSYSLYLEQLADYFSAEIGEGFLVDRGQAMEILQKEAELQEIVRLIGIDALSQEERLLLETARSIREDFLHQNAFDDVDTYSSLGKQASMLRLILLAHDSSLRRLKAGEPMEGLLDDPVRERIARAKYVPEEEFTEAYKAIAEEIRGIDQPAGGG